MQQMTAVTLNRFSFSVDQVKENMLLFKQAVQRSHDQLDMLHKAFHDIDPRVIIPGVRFYYT